MTRDGQGHRLGGRAAPSRPSIRCQASALQSYQFSCSSLKRSDAPWIVLSSGGIWEEMISKEWYSASPRPQGNIRSRTSCICFVSCGPTEVVSIARHWKIGASNGAFFLLKEEARISLNSA